ncbi:hypothetical protein ACFFMO_04925 [Lederbergia wuyishanensis]
MLTYRGKGWRNPLVDRTLQEETDVSIHGACSAYGFSCDRITVGVIAFHSMPPNQQRTLNGLN